jgi:hypothetical protein
VGDSVTIASVVEGHGEVSAVPALVRKVASECFDCHVVNLPKPHRVPRGQMVTGDHLARALQLQAARVTGRGGVLVILDADDDCPVELGRKLATTTSSANIQVAVANREFEAWFLAGIESLRAHRMVKDKASYAPDPDLTRDAKGALTDLMIEKYNETLHQPAFASLLDVNAAMRSRSFRHFVDSIGRLVSLAPPSHAQA